MPRKLEVPNLDDLIRRYKAGESLKQLADEVGVSRGGKRDSTGKPFGLTGAFIAAGVQLRGRSEAERVKWASLTDPARRNEQVRAANKARRGAKDPESRKCARARTRFFKCLHAAPSEQGLADALEVLRFSVRRQFPLGKYNLDIALDELLIAVEVEDEWSSGNYPGELFNRTKDILDSGWCVVFVVGRFLDVPYVARKILAFTDAIRRDKSLYGQYWVLGSHPNRRPRGSSKLDGLPRITSLEST